MNFKNSIKKTLLRSGVLRLKQSLMPRSAAILYYHSVSADREGQAYCITPGITIEAERFREHMRILRKWYNPVTLDEIADWLRGSRTLPPRSVAVTFDDGFADNEKLAAPIMEEFGIFGTFYLTVGSIVRQELPWFCRMEYLFKRAEKEKRILSDTESGQQWNFAIPEEKRAAYVHLAYPCARLSGEEQYRHIDKVERLFGFHLDPATAPKMMTFEQARELRKRGHLIGCHTFSHGNMAHIPSRDLHREIVESTEILSKELGEPVKHFSYPHPCLNPQWNEETLALTRKCVFETTVLTQFGTVTQKTHNLLLPRITIGNLDSEAFFWIIETAFAGIKT